MAKKAVKGEAAFDAFCELIEPIFEVSQDEELYTLYIEQGAKNIEWLAAAIKRHKETFMKTLSLLSGMDAEEMDFLAVYHGASKLFENGDLLRLFLPRSQNRAKSGSVSENTEESEE